MGFFEQFFNISDGLEGEVSVLCPFPHYTANGIPYHEHKESASVNLTRRLFHCKVCEAGYNERQFIKEVEDCSLTNASRLETIFKNENGTRQEWERQYKPAYEQAEKFGITKQVVNDLHITTTNGENLCFPAFMYDYIVDVRTYQQGATPKVLSMTGALHGCIIPYDLWRKTPKSKNTIICAGEKDMATTRSHGFNAITLTGGEMSLPSFYAEFKDRNVVICYDNDNTGIKAAKKLARQLKPICHSVKVCTLFHNVCKEPKEDLTDYWNKYHGTREDLIKMFNATPEYEPEKDEDVQKEVPYKSLTDYSSDPNMKKIARCNIQVVATSETVYRATTHALCTKVHEANGSNAMCEGEDREWILTENNLRDILHIVDGGFKEDDIKNHIKTLAHVPPGEKYIKVESLEQQTVYKLYVSELEETNDYSATPMEYTAYCLGKRLESGQKYEVVYTLVPHPYKGSQLTMIIIDAKPATDSVTKFEVNESNKQLLDTFRTLKGSVKERMNLMIEKAKGLIGYNGDNQLIELIDLTYHSVLNFRYGSSIIRGYLDTIIVGESRIGKSSTANALREAYGLGTFVSLAGNSATIPGLIGGSNKMTNGSMQTKAGIIPQNNKGMLIFEEFSKCNANIIRELTDIRSSNRVRITRVSGSLELPSYVRMLTLSNPKVVRGRIKSIASYPNGISVITELVENAEDIARYDLIGVLGTKGNSQIDPLWKPEAPFELDALRARIRWVWSRNPEQIVLTEDVIRYIMDCANNLNHLYSTHIKIFGTEAQYKLVRLAVAIAAYLVSTDDTYQNVIVTKEHVDYAVNLMCNLYDNETFKLKEYADLENRYTKVQQGDVEILTDLYIKYGPALEAIEQSSETAKSSLANAGALSNEDATALTKQLITHYFAKETNNYLYPTERFRKAVKGVDKEHLRVSKV